MPLLNTCCCCFSTRTGTLIIGIMSLITSILGAVASVAIWVSWEYISKEVRKNPPADVDVEELLNFVRISVIVFLVMCVIAIIITSMLIHGVRKMKPGLLLPYIVLSVICMILAVVFNVYLMINGKRTITGIVNICVGTLVSIYYILVVYSHYQELRNREGRMSVPTDSKF